MVRSALAFPVGVDGGLGWGAGRWPKSSDRDTSAVASSRKACR